MREILSVHKIGYRLLGMIHGVDSTIMPMHLLEVCLSVVQVYAGLYLTAGLIDLLLAGAYGQAAEWALYLLLVNLLLGTATVLLKRKFRGMETRIWQLFYVWMREKAFSLDYETMERPEISEKILFSERRSNMHGGLGMLLYYYCDILRAFLHILLSAAMVLYVCMARPSQEAGFWGTLARPLPSMILFGGALAGMAVGSWKVYSRFGARIQEIFESHTGVENKISYLQMQVLGDAKVGKIIRLYGMQEMIFKNAMENLKSSVAFFGKMCDVERGQENANNVVSSLFAAGSYLLVALKAVTGAVTVGAFTQYAGAMNQFGSGCFKIIACHGGLREICTYMGPFLEFLDTDNLHAKGSIPVEKRTDGEYELAFEHVDFQYPGCQELVLKDVNCRLRIRGKLAVVGKNGAGKTTFINLLCRLYEPTAGRITLNGVDIRKYDEEEYRSLFGVVFQDFKLFAFPVWQNVTAGGTREDDRIRAALRQADAAEFVEKLPQGLDTYLYQELEEGVTVSGGEAQKLALARALYKDAPVVILDEPTAALDPKAEAEVYERFHKMVEGRTSIYISHRMSSCRFCDEIIVFDKGQIVERGSHETLYAAGGSYARMWDAQARYYA